MAYRTIKQTGGKIYEYQAAAALSPGMLLEVDSNGKVKKHATAGGAVGSALFASEFGERGGKVTDAYAANDQVKVIGCGGGDVVVGLLANGENAAKGSLLESNGDGYLRVVDTDTSAGTIKVGSIVGVALDALDMSGSSGVDPSSQLLRVLVK